ncbi:MAG: hypothetical protein ABI609_15005, partial [Acidobacteriota bacterium]
MPRGSTHGGGFTPRPSGSGHPQPQWQAPRGENHAWRGQPSDSSRGDNRGNWNSSGSPGRPYQSFSHDGRGDWRNNRNDHRGQGFSNGSSWRGGGRYDRFQGRVCRLSHVRGGYYAWLDGRRDSFWIPEARFLLWPLHVGLSVNFGGGWDPAGYYNVYDVGPGANAYRSTATLQGVVESVDFDRGIVVVR